MKKHFSHFCGTKKTISVICAAWLSSLFTNLAYLLAARYEHLGLNVALFSLVSFPPNSHFYLYWLRGLSSEGWKKTQHVLEEPVTELMCWSMGSCWCEYVHFGSGTGKYLLKDSWGGKGPDRKPQSQGAPPLRPTQFRYPTFILENVAAVSKKLVAQGTFHLSISSASFCPIYFMERYHFGLKKNKAGRGGGGRKTPATPWWSIWRK